MNEQVTPADVTVLEKRTAAINIQNASHRFKNHRALVDVSFTVTSGSLHGFVGPNGAGKTTTLKLICTLLEPQRGQFRVFGHDIRKSVQKVRRRIGFMPDHLGMYRQMTVHEYLDFFAAAYGLSSEARRTAVRDVLELTDLGGRTSSLISSLSRGMQQRTSLARVLVSDPDLLLLDEPASGLDPRARIELMEILRALRSMGKTIFISSHILSELADLCDSVTIIDRGQIKYSGSMDDLLVDNSQDPIYRITVAGAETALEDSIAALPGVRAVERIEGNGEYQVTLDGTAADQNSLLRGLMDLGVRIEQFAPERRHLNQAFLDLTEAGVR